MTDRAIIDAYVTSGYFLDSEVRQVVLLMKSISEERSQIRALALRLEDAVNKFRETHLEIELARFGKKSS